MHIAATFRLFSVHLNSFHFNRRWVSFFPIIQTTKKTQQKLQQQRKILSYDQPSFSKCLLCQQYNRFSSVKYDSTDCVQWYCVICSSRNFSLLFWFRLNSIFYWIGIALHCILQELWCKVFEMLSRYFIIRLGTTCTRISISFGMFCVRFMRPTTINRRTICIVRWSSIV